MRIPKKISTAVAITMSIFMSQIPSTAMATEMIPTSAVVAELSHAQTRHEVADYLKRSDVQAELLKQGVSPDEISSRLASLSEVELRQLSGQLEQARAGGDILITVLIVVLIIYLIKRM